MHSILHSCRVPQLAHSLLLADSRRHTVHIYIPMCCWRTRQFQASSRRSVLSAVRCISLLQLSPARMCFSGLRRYSFMEACAVMACVCGLFAVFERVSEHFPTALLSTAESCGNCSPPLHAIVRRLLPDLLYYRGKSCRCFRHHHRLSFPFCMHSAQQRYTSQPRSCPRRLLQSCRWRFTHRCWGFKSALRGGGQHAAT